MLTLRPNTLNITGRIIMLCLLVLLEYLFIHYGFKNSKFNNNIYALYFLIALYFLAFLFIMISLLGIIKVEANKILHTFTFTVIFYKKTISKNEINAYYTTFHKGKSIIHYHGILLVLNDSKTIQLAGQNLKSVNQLKEYLTSIHINYLGERKQKFPFI